MPPKKSAAAASAKRTATVADYLASLAHPRKADIERVRDWVRATDPRVSEAIKWNAPSFCITEHFATFRLAPRDIFQLVLHTGAKASTAPRALTIDDPQQLLRWAAPDRAVIDFDSVTDLPLMQDALTAILRQWIAQTVE